MLRQSAPNMERVDFDPSDTEGRLSCSRTTRGKPKSEAPFCWQSKRALSKISTACDGRTDKAQVLASYVALTWEASNRQAESFVWEKQNLAAKAGISYRKAADILKFLAEIGVIISKPNFIEGSKAQGANTYTLCSVCTPPEQSMHAPRAGYENSLPAETREESIEESKEESNKGQAKPAHYKFIPPTPDEVEAYAHEINYPLNGQAWCDSFAQKGWKVGKNKMTDWQAALRTWKAQGWMPNAKPSTSKLEERFNTF